MSRDPAWRTNLKSLAKSRPGLADLFFNMKYLPTADDRIVGILAATEIEDRLEDLIRSKMVKLNGAETGELFSSTAPLGTHGTRIRLAYALGYIGPKTRDDLEIIRLIRNAFAHSRKAIWFSTDEIKAACEKLSAPHRVNLDSRYLKEHLPLDSPKKLFLGSINLMVLAMMRVVDPWLFRGQRRKHFLPLD